MTGKGGKRGQLEPVLGKFSQNLYHFATYSDSFSKLFYFNSSVTQRRHQ